MSRRSEILEDIRNVFGDDLPLRKDSISEITNNLNRLLRAAKICVPTSESETPALGAVFRRRTPDTPDCELVVYSPVPFRYKKQDQSFFKAAAHTQEGAELLKTMFIAASGGNSIEGRFGEFLANNRVEWLSGDAEDIRAWNSQFSEALTAVAIVSLARNSAQTDPALTATQKNSYFPYMEGLETSDTVPTTTPSEEKIKSIFEYGWAHGMGGEVGSKFVLAYTEMVTTLNTLLSLENIGGTFAARRKNHLKEYSRIVGKYRFLVSEWLGGLKVKKEEAASLVKELEESSAGEIEVLEALDYVHDSVSESADAAVDVSTGVVGWMVSKSALKLLLARITTAGGVAVGVGAGWTVVLFLVMAAGFFGTRFLTSSTEAMTTLTKQMSVTIKFWKCITIPDEMEGCTAVVKKVMEDKCDGRPEIVCRVELGIKTLIGGYISYQLLSYARERLK